MLHPVLVQFGGVPILTHDLCVGLGVLVAAGVFAAQARYRRRLGDPVDDRIWAVVAGALVGGALLGRLGTWLRHVDLRRNASFVEHWMYGNRSILSGLLGAYVGALLAKRLVGYVGRTGDLFAPAVAAGMAVGRVGCLLSELPGTRTSLPWGVALDPADAAFVGAPPGVPLHPSFGYEIVFHACALVLLLRLRGRVAVPGAPDRPAPGAGAGRRGVWLAPGELLTVYLIGYAVFRFAVEFVRGNEVVLAGLTRPQLFLLACAPLAGVQVTRMCRRSVPAMVGVSR